MDSDKISKTELNHLESSFRQAILTGDTPFLGFQKCFPKNIRFFFERQMLQSKDPLTLYQYFVSQWPAVFLKYLTLYIAEGFGESGTFEVYPFIEKALGIKGLTQNQKERLWKSFRRNCISLGLSVSSRLSGTHFMVSEYLRQTGAPLKYIPDLTDKMLRYASAVGLPDDDDPSSVKLWQLGLVETLRLPFSKTMRKAIEADDTNFLVLLFLKVLNQPPVLDNTNSIETIMSKAIHDQTERTKRIIQKKGQGITIPQVIWRDQQLGVELPSGESHSWKITVGDSVSEFQGMMESRFEPFTHELPSDVQIDYSLGGISRNLPLWEDLKNNRLLIFTSEGILVCGAKLGSSDPITMEPGNYIFVSRFIPEGMEDTIEEVHHDPDIFEFSVFLEPGQLLTLNRGPASLNIVADSKPLLAWEGNSVKGIRGNEIFSSSGTHLRVIIPSELLLGGEATYFVRLNPGHLGKEIDIPLANAGEGQLHIDIENVCQIWKPGVTRLLAEIRRDGMQRSVVRSAIYLWNGLSRIENRTTFYYSAEPSNLIPEDCDNLLIHRDQSFLTYRNDDNRFFRMVFNLGDTKRLTLTLPVPGVFMQLKDYSKSHVVEKMLRKGSVLSVGWNSRCVLEIFSTINGTLRLGKYQKRVDFKACGSKRLPLAGLIEYLEPNSDTLIFINDDTQDNEELVRLIAPHEVLKFFVQQTADQIIISFSLAQQASEIKMSAVNIVSGTGETLHLGCNRSMARSESGINGWLTCEYETDEGVHAHELRIILKNWPDGAWLLDFNVNINNRWGSFSNSRGDDYSSGFIITNGKIVNNHFSVLREIDAVNLDDKLNILKRVHRTLLRCYAQEAWNDLAWIKKLWLELTHSFEEKEHYALRLISLANEKAPKAVSNSWVPMLCLTSRLPWLYSLPIRSYHGVSSKSNSQLMKCLYTMNSIEFGLLELIKESVLHQIVAMGFENIVEMTQKNEKPKKFSMKRYDEALKSQNLSDRIRLLQEEDWQPGDGDYLGALHYLHAVEQMKKFYHDTLAGNDYRRGKALYLCKTLNYFPHKGINHDTLGHLRFNITMDTLDDESSNDQENILHISRFLSLFARACRWEVREKGSLKDFIGKARQIVEDNDQFDSILGFLLYIGRDVFGFYLLLWESIVTADFTTGENNNYV